MADQLNQHDITVVLNEPIYSLWSFSRAKSSLVSGFELMRMDSFHTVCTFTVAIGKRLGDAGVADIPIENQMVLLALILLLDNKRKAELSVHIR